MFFFSRSLAGYIPRRVALVFTRIGIIDLVHFEAQQNPLSGLIVIFLSDSLSKHCHPLLRYSIHLDYGASSSSGSSSTSPAGGSRGMERAVATYMYDVVSYFRQLFFRWVCVTLTLPTLRATMSLLAGCRVLLPGMVFIGSAILVHYDNHLAAREVEACRWSRSPTFLLQTSRIDDFEWNARDLMLCRIF